MHVSCQFDPRTPRKLVQLSCVAVASEDNVTDVKFSCSYGGSFSSLIASGRVDEACSSFRAIRAAGHLQTHQDALPPAPHAQFRFGGPTDDVVAAVITFAARARSVGY